LIGNVLIVGKDGVLKGMLSMITENPNPNIIPNKPPKIPMLKAI
jgi:hypothetical protein